MKPGKPETQVPPKEDLEKPQQEEVVELDAQTGKVVEAPKSTESSTSSEELRKIQARIEFQARNIERQQREFDERVRQFNQQTIQPATQNAEKPQEKDNEFDEELHQIAQVNYQKAIRIQAQREAKKIAQEEFKTLMETRDRQAQAQNEQYSAAQSLEQSKARVLEQYPSLNDESSEEFKTYYQVYNEELQKNPRLARNPEAPELIMYRMEKRLKDKPKNPVASLEADRVERVQATGSPQGRPITSQKTIKLSQEEIDFCTKKKISPQIYARVKESNLKEGVSA
jgi:hypothetical protein